MKNLYVVSQAVSAQEYKSTISQQAHQPSPATNVIKSASKVGHKTGKKIVKRIRKSYLFLDNEVYTSSMSLKQKLSVRNSRLRRQTNDTKKVLMLPATTYDLKVDKRSL